MNKHEALATTDLFRSLSASALSALAEMGNISQYTLNEIIVEQAEQVRTFFVVLEGKVKMFRSSPDGREQTLYIFEAGEPFCLCAAISGKGFPASVAAMSSATVFAVPWEQFERIAAQQPRVMFSMLQVMSKRLKEAMDMVESLSLKEIPERIAVFLLHTPVDEAGTVLLGMTHRELSKVVGATPESLSRALKKMTMAGILSVNSGEIVIVDRSKLEQLSEGLL